MWRAGKQSKAKNCCSRNEIGELNENGMNIPWFLDINLASSFMLSAHSPRGCCVCTVRFFFHWRISMEFVVFCSFWIYIVLPFSSFSFVFWDQGTTTKEKITLKATFEHTHIHYQQRQKMCIYLRSLCNRNYTKPIILYVQWYTALLSLAWYAVVFMFFDVLFMFLLIHLASLTTMNWPTSADCSVCVLFWKCFGVSSIAMFCEKSFFLIARASCFLFFPQRIPGWLAGDLKKEK